MNDDQTPPPTDTNPNPANPKKVSPINKATGQRIRLARRAVGLTQVQLAAKIEADQSTVSKWERGDNLPDFGNLGPLSRALNTTPEALMGQATIDLPPIRMVRVAGVVAAGAWREALDSDDLDDVPVPPLPAKYDKVKLQAFRVVGDSMNLVYPDGSTVYVAPIRSVVGAPKTGDRVLVMRHDGGLTEATLKEYVSDGKGRWLWPRSSSPEFQAPIEYKSAGDVEITGVVIAGLVVR